ncbi:MAG: rRNA small subunit methyltransferase [Polyangiaceae bacterium]|jgi:16S rRNA (cytosine1402-N4)-methyltransferase|nr:rRNA small subunit methyltransferase [Polyangiaceae bacterium]
MTMSELPFDPKSSFSHLPVLLEEVTSSLAVATGGLFVDATAGGAGHSRAILAASQNVRLIATDRDLTAIDTARERLTEFGERAHVAHARFSEIAAVLDEAGCPEVDGILADLGVSSFQLDTAERGMSFRHQGPLDMRMDTSRGETALELIERLDQDELADVIYELGEERSSRRVARCIKQALAEGMLSDTIELRRAIVRAVGPRRVGGIDPATRTFQALRMAVNGELSEISALLKLARTRIKPGGVLAVISFHSLEDRLVKREFQNRATWAPLTKKPIIATDEEQAKNPRSRSAKLRVARRLAPGEGGDA